MRKVTRPSRRMVRRYVKQIQLLMRFHEKDDKFTLLDLGTEFGYLGRYTKKAFPNVQITGVDIFQPVLEGCRFANGRFYDTLELADACSYVRRKDIPLWDVIVAAEIIEHLPKRRGFELLELLKEKADLVIVTSPIGFKRQGMIYGNPYESHLSGWGSADLEMHGFTTYIQDQLGYTQGIYYYASGHEEENNA